MRHETLPGYVMNQRASDAQEGPMPRRVAWSHRGQRPCARTAGQAQQHGFGLIVEGVREQDLRSPPRTREIHQGRPPRPPRSSLRAAFLSDLDPSDLYVVDTNGSACLRSALRDIRGVSLESVIHDADGQGST
jgi:hypothetical protein